MGRLDGKVALISGGARGQGATETRLFVSESAKVVFGDILDAEGQKVEAELRAAGGEATYVHLDVTSERDWHAAVEMAVRQYGQLHVLVNNAGIIIRKSIEETSVEDWDRTQGINVKGVFLGTKYAIPAMRQAGGGSIVNIASVRSIVAGGNNLQYDTTKAAVAGLTRGLAMDHAVDGIRVNAVCPGPILTPFHERRIAAAGKTLDDYRAESSARTMLKRPGTPQEVAACVLFLASEDASYVTGTCLFVDGGFTAL